MNYQEVIDNIRDLGFSDDEEMTEFGELIPNAINRAITEISLSAAPIIEKYELTIGKEDTGYMYIDMTDIDSNFMDFGETPVLFATYTQGNDGVLKESPTYQRFNDFWIEAPSTMVINADNITTEASFRIFYKAAHTPFVIGDEVMLQRQLPLPLKAHHLVPLLASYYVWLEDEPTKAAQYFNFYEQKSEEVKAVSQENKPRLRVMPGGI